MNYALDTPTRRALYTPQEHEAHKLVLPPHTPETDQSHRGLQWLFHKPQEHAIFPAQPASGRFEKKN
jgi:hypothetical protein